MYHLRPSVVQSKRSTLKASLRLECGVFDKDVATSQGPQTRGSLVLRSLVTRSLLNCRLAAPYRPGSILVHRKWFPSLLRIHNQHSGAIRSRTILGQSTQTAQLAIKRLTEDFTHRCPLVGFQHYLHKGRLMTPQTDPSESRDLRQE